MVKFRNRPKRSSSNTKHAPGQIYIILAEGFHGIIPGLFLYRCKIGLAVDAYRRLKQLQSIQAPCNYKILKVISVRDMAVVENKLHKQFSSCNVQLKQSREWFDLNLWQLWLVYRAFKYHKTYTFNKMSEIRLIPSQAIAFIFIGLLIVVAVTSQFITGRNIPKPVKTLNSHQHLTQGDNKRIRHIFIK